MAGNSVTGAFGGGITVTDSPGNAVTGNTVFSNADHGIALSGASDHTTIANNITRGSTVTGTGRDAEISVAAASESGTTVHHNIVYPTAARPPFDGEPAVPAGSPYFWGDKQYPDVASFASKSGQGTHDLMTDPLLNGLAGDPLPGSPAIDSADSSAPGALPTDQNGNPRVDDPQVADTGAGPGTYDDRGAFEYQGGPVTNFAYSVTGDATHETITIDARASIPGFSPIGSYTANFNGTVFTSDNPVFSETFPVSADPAATKGQQILDVTATGTDGKAGSRAELMYTLGTVIQPKAELTVSADPNTPGGILADPTASAPAVGPRDGDSMSFITMYTIDWGDGSTQWVENAPVTAAVPHIYTKSGTYSVKLTVETGTLQKATTTRPITVTVPVTPTPPPPGGGSTPPGGAPTPPAATGPTTPAGTVGAATVTRLGGGDRYATARIVSRTQWKDGAAGGVVIARGDVAPDALAGVPLAAHARGPLLMTDPKTLDTATAAEVKRVLGADKSKPVYLLGGTAAVSQEVETQLKALGYQVHRIGGATRFDTALRIAKDGLGSPANVVVATGTDFADALAAGLYAAAGHAAVVLSDGPALDPATAAYVESRGVVTAVGGSAVQAVRGSAPGKPFTDLHGSDRYATAVAVAGAMTDGGPAPSALGIASGTVFPDALTGGAYAANAGVPLLLTDPKALPDTVRTLLVTWHRQLAAVEHFGGPAALSDTADAQVVEAVGSHPA